MIKRFPIKIKTFRKIVLALAFAILFFGSGYQFARWQTGYPPELSTSNSKAPDQIDFHTFWQVWHKLENDYVDPKAINYQKMTYGSIEGLAQSLGDPYTRYFPPADNKVAEEDLNGSFYGVGIELGYKDGTLAVITPLENSPAQKAGLKAGDLIMHLQDKTKNLDEDTAGMSLRDAVKKIRGEKGVPITFKIAREGEKKLLDITIVRDKIIVPSLKLEFTKVKGHKIAHLSLYQFGGRTKSEWLTKVKEIKRAKAEALVLDLRNNPGGYLDGAIFIASEFLPKGIIVKQAGRYQTKTYQVNRHGQLLDIPLAVLINKGSASASEITAGALQVNHRATIIGQQSFGKGTVQEVADFPDGSSLHVTIAKWLLPDGRWIGDGGIKPDIQIKDNPQTKQDEVLDKAYERLVSNLD